MLVYDAMHGGFDPTEHRGDLRPIEVVQPATGPAMRLDGESLVDDVAVPCEGAVPLDHLVFGQEPRTFQ
jgi:hypothetical protein